MKYKMKKETFANMICKSGDSKPPYHINDYLDKVLLPKLNITEINECDKELSEE